MGIKVIQTYYAQEMIEFIKNHLDYPKEKLEEICDIFLETIEKKTFKAYE